MSRRSIWIEQSKMGGVRQGVRRVGVDLQGDLAESLAHRTDRLDVPARLDLELDAAVALLEVVAHGLQQLRDGPMNAHRDAGVDGRAHRAKVRRERFTLGAKLGVEDCHLDRGLGHVMAMDGAQNRANVLGLEARLVQ